MRGLASSLAPSSFLSLSLPPSTPLSHEHHAYTGTHSLSLLISLYVRGKVQGEESLLGSCCFLMAVSEEASKGDEGERRMEGGRRG